MSEQFQIFCPDCLAPIIIEPGNPAQEINFYCACGAQILSADLTAFSSDKLQRFMTDSALPLLVYFHVPDCMTCTMMTPIIDRLAKKLRGTVCCAKIDARKDSDLASAYGVCSVPTIILFKSGSTAKRFSGAMDIKSLTAWIME